VGSEVGLSVGNLVGNIVGFFVGECVGLLVGALVGPFVGFDVELLVGDGVTGDKNGTARPSVISVSSGSRKIASSGVDSGASAQYSVCSRK